MENRGEENAAALKVSLKASCYMFSGAIVSFKAILEWWENDDGILFPVSGAPAVQKLRKNVHPYIARRSFFFRVALLYMSIYTYISGNKKSTLSSALFVTAVKACWNLALRHLGTGFDLRVTGSFRKL